MFDDILGNKEKIKKESNESIIDSMKYNIEEKDKLIKKLIQRITELEKHIEIMDFGQI